MMGPSPDYYCPTCDVCFAGDELDGDRHRCPPELAPTAWQPIDTAPRDGTPVLAFCPSYYQGKGGIIVALWMEFSDEKGWYDNLAFRTTPTHWMPLPAPPTEGG